jgi:phosphoglycerol transferase MdoB-like AlkP superfamily enzyme
MILDIGDGLTMGIKYNIFIAFDLWQWLIIFCVTIYGIWLLNVKMTGKNYTITKISLPYSSIVLVSVLVLFFSSAFIKPAHRKIYDTPQDKRTYLFTFGMSTFNQKDTIKTISKVITRGYLKVKAQSELENVNQNTKANTSNVNGAFQNKNLIMIMMETVEEYAIDEKLTPTLFYLMNQGYNFTNAYGVAKTNNTYDAEFKSLTSMMYYDTNNIMYSFDKNEFTNALPNLLRDNGYTANSFHSNTKTYFNRENMHKALGFERFYAKEDMKFREDVTYPLDSELFDQMKDLYAPVQDQPFFSFIVTYSTHGPFIFEEPKPEFKEYYEKIQADGRFDKHEKEFINLLAAQMNLDEGLETMLNDLKDKGLLNDTIIVLFSDHKNYSSSDITKKYTPLTTENEIYNYEIDKVPFAIYNPQITPRKIDYLTSQYDILPTIVDLLGIKIIKDYYYGQSVFLYDIDKYENKPIIFGYNRWIDKKMIVYDTKILYIDPSVEDEETYFLELQAQVFGTINIYHAFLLNDYFRKTAN